MKPTLEQYFRENQEKNGIIDYSIRANAYGKKVSFYIHAQNKDSETLDFCVTGNELRQYQDGEVLYE